MKTLNHSKCIKSILLLKDKNILISGGKDGTKFWNIKNFNIKFEIKEAYCNNLWYPIDIIDENRIIVVSDKKLNIISLLEKKIIDSIDNECSCNGIKVIKNKGIILVSEFSSNIKIYRSDNYECIGIKKNVHENNIIGFNILNENLIVSFSYDRKINIWEIK